MAWIDMWTGTWAALWGTDVPDPNEMGDYYNTQVEIYADTSFGTLMDIINARYEPSVLSELRGHGAGSFKVSKYDSKIMKNPKLLEYRNYVKIRLNGLVIGGFVIQNKKTVIVGSGEERDETWEISGEGPRSWVKDASVYPAKGLKNSSAEARYFNFSTEQGSWYNSSDWPYAAMRWSWNNVSNGAPKGHAPANWPDASGARWIWNTTYDGSDPQGFCYFRHEFTTTGTAGKAYNYALFIAADDAAEVFVDGEQKAVIEAPGWHDTTRVEMELEPGSHVIGVKAYNIGPGGPGEILTALFSYGDPDAPTPAVLLNHSGMANTWRVNAYPAAEPGWTTGDVLLTLLNEAKARGVRFANNFTPTFSSTVDSGGNAWADPVPWTFDIGSTYEEVISVAEELGCDVFVDPDTLEMHVWVKRGVDRSLNGPLPASNGNVIIFSPGHNLVSADETGQAEIANTLMLRTPEGWKETTAQDQTSIQKYGRVETQMSTGLTSSGAASLVEELFRQKALPEVSATFDIVPTPGMIPFIDFNVGDWVSAPGEVPGVKESRRVMSISFTEDDSTGLPLYALEFDTIFKDRQAELEKWISRISNSSAIGGGFTNSSTLPPKVIVSPPGNPEGVVPDAPTGLVVSSVGKYLPDGSSSSDYGLTWNAVVTGSGFGSVEISQYEVWARLVTETESNLLTVVFDTFAYLPGFRPGDEWVFKIRAISKTGGPGNFSDEVTLIAEAPQVPLLTPSAPTLSSDVGSVAVKWDGLLGGNPAPSYMKYLRVERKLTSGSTWEVIGSMLGTSFNDVSGTVGTSYDYRFIAEDRYGNVSPASPSATIVVAGVEVGDIDSAITDAIDEALNTANEANDAVGGSIATSTEEYAQNSSPTTAPTTGWSTTPPAWTAGTYIWRRSRNTTIAGTVTTSLPVVVTGNDGQSGTSGTDATSVQVGNDNISLPVTSDGATLSSSTFSVPFSGWIGNARAAATVAVTGLPSGITLTTNTPATTSADGNLVFTVASGSTLGGGNSGTITLTITSNSKSYVYMLTWSKAFSGANGTPGATGGTGPTGVSVSTIIRYFATGTSAPAKPTTTTPPAPWSLTEPTYVPGSTVNMYYTDKTTFSNSTFSWSNVQLSATFAAAKDAVTIAGTATKITRSTADPSGVGEANQVWQKIDGTTKDVIQEWYWDGSAWVEQKIRNERIANLDAGKITSGYLDVQNRIDAGSITTTKLIVGDLSNMAEINEQYPGTVSFGNWTHTITDGWSTRSDISTNQYFMFRNKKGPLPFRDGDRIRLVFDAFADATLTVMPALYVYTPNELGVEEGQYQLFPSVDVTASPGRYAVEMDISVSTVGATSYLIGIQGVLNQNVRVRNVRAQVMNAGELIVDGSITSRMVNAEEIWSDAAFLENAKINILTAGSITTDHLAASVGNSLDISSNTSVNILIDSKTQATRDGLSDTQETLGKMTTYYSFGPSGATISNPDSTFKLMLTNSGIEIRENDTPVSWWDSQRMVVPSFVGTEVVLGNHKLEKSGTGTVVKASPTI